MSIILTILEYNKLTEYLKTIPFGMFNNEEDAELFAETMIKKDKNEYIKEFGEEYVNSNFIFKSVIRDKNKKYFSDNLILSKNVKIF